jgi:hypothetical protein
VKHVEPVLDDQRTSSGRRGCAGRADYRFSAQGIRLDVSRIGVHGGRRVCDGQLARILQAVVGNRLVFYGLLIAELGLVWYLSARVSQLAPTTAGALFMVYSGLNGLTFSVILLAYSGASIANAF